MKKISFFLITMLLLLVVSLVFVMQNNAPVAELKFLIWSIPPVSVGILSLFSLFAGVIIMWLVSVMVYIGNSARFNRNSREKDKLLKLAREEKEKLQEELSRLKLELQEKQSDLQGSDSSVKKLENEQEK